MADQAEIKAAAGRLRRRLAILQNHQRGVWVAEGVGLLLTVVVPALGLAMILDNLFHLPFVLRLLLLAGLVGGAVELIRYMVRLVREPLTPERMAVKVEGKFPQVDNRLINSLLLANEDDEEASELIRSVIEEGNADATKLDLRSAVRKRKMGLLLATTALAFGLMGVYGVMYPNQFGNALARILLPFAAPGALTRTQIVAVSPKDHDLLSGDDVTIAVELSGKLPGSAEVVYVPENEETDVAVMRPGDRPNQFRCLMADVRRSFTYRVVAGDARSDGYRITVHHRPVVSALKITLTPPEYTDGKPVEQNSGTIRALPGSTVEVHATCSKPISRASLEVSGSAAQQMKVEGEKVVGSFTVTRQATYRILLTDTFGFENKPVDRDIEPLADEPPQIELTSPPETVVVRPEQSLPFKLTAKDDYGVKGVEIVQVVKDADGTDHDSSLMRWLQDHKKQKTVPVEHLLPVSQLKIQPGQSGVLQVVAKDWNDVTGPGVTRSRQVVVQIMLPEQAHEKSREAMKLAALELARIIEKQRINLRLGQGLRADEIRTPGSIARAPEGLNASIRLQEEIRTASGKLLGIMDQQLPMRAVLKLLYEEEMVTAVRQLKAVAPSEKPADALGKALETERTILARLTGRSEQLRRALDTSAMRDVLALLEKIRQAQKKIRAVTEATSQPGVRRPNAPLADRQDKLATKVVLLKDQLTEHARAVAQSDSEMAKRFDQAAKMVDSRAIRQNMLLCAAKMAKGDLHATLPVQDKILADLKAIADFLREPIVADAAKKLEELQDLVQESKEKAERLAKLQASVKEISEELERSKDYRGEEAKEAAQKSHELEDLREKMKDVVEQMAKDLELFPEVPTCNELVQEMREVFEDVEQKKGSEGKPAKEIAVDRDEGMLAALDKIKERLADMEMWLMDEPDTTKWKQEAWDKNEMPDIPLVDLPEELEDLVGDLVDQEEEVDEEAQDSASNASTADIPAGWDVADGPINNWSAKGKSGNAKPNANEMAGRSGAGREGNANGELVEGKAKDLEGRETKARRTHDPFGEGVIEEEDPKSEARATGGGKQSGTGGEGGLRGTAPPRNELAMRELERRQRELRRNTESVYSKACLLYLPTGELDKAVLLMQKAEEQARAGDYAGFSETQRRIVHALRNTKRMLDGKGAVEMDPRHRLPMDIKEEMFDARDEPIPPEFERLVARYYKAIATGVVK